MNTTLLFVENSFQAFDYVIFFLYCLTIIGIGLWVSRDKKGHDKNTSDYFLASKSLTWWVIGSSLIASNISAEQIVGMSGSGYAMGMAIASYEFMAAATLVVVGVFFLPVFIKKQIYTMPQFLASRFSPGVRNMMAIFWVVVYVFINLASVLHLGALSMEKVMGINYFSSVIGLALFALVYSIYGGLKAVAITDVFQVVFLIIGGLITTFMALELVGAGNWLNGLSIIFEKAPEHFSMIINEGEILMETISSKGGENALVGKDAYMDLPGISVLVGGLWIANLYYWGFNQYITQRALAAKSMEEARKGIVFAALLKFIVPFIVVLPGIATYVLVNGDYNPGDFGYEQIMTLRGSMSEIINVGKPDTWVRPDNAYPSLLHLLPVGLKGLAFAALTAAIVSSLASMVNSTSTICTMDLYKNLINKNASEVLLVRVGRIVGVIAFVLACVTTPALRTLDQAFQFIQEFTGLVSPAVVVVFITGIFWRKTTTTAALTSILISIPLGFLLKVTLPQLPFMDRMGIVFIILLFLIIVISLVQGKGRDNDKAIKIDPAWFKASSVFWGGTALIFALLAALYSIFY